MKTLILQISAPVSQFNCETEISLMSGTSNELLLPSKRKEKKFSVAAVVELVMIQQKFFFLNSILVLKRRWS